MKLFFLNFFIIILSAPQTPQGSRKGIDDFVLFVSTSNKMTLWDAFIAIGPSCLIALCFSYGCLALLLWWIKLTETETEDKGLSCAKKT